MKKPLKEFTTYLFDADGTLFDTTEMIIRCFINTATVHHLFVPDRDAIISHIGMTLRRQMECYFGVLTDEQFDQYRQTHMNYQLKIYKEHLQLCPGVAEALKALQSRGKQCAVVTSRMIQTLTIYLQETGILPYFTVLITPAETNRHKPEPEPALTAMEQLGAVAKDTLFIGDSTFDIECGGRAGCATAFVTWSHTRVEQLTRTPDYCIATMRELCVW